MDYKKLILAGSICAIASVVTFLKSSQTPSNKQATQQIQTKVENKNELPNNIGATQKDKNLSNIKNSEEVITVHKKKKVELTGDPYKDLLLKIENNEEQITEEQRQESLQQYLATTVKASELEQLPQVEPGYLNAEGERGREEILGEEAVGNENTTATNNIITENTESRETGAEE